MSLTAEQLNEAAYELLYQDKQNGLPAEPFRDTVARVQRMGPVQAQMLVIKAIWDTVETGKEWARTPEGIARQIGRAAAALQARRAAVGVPIVTIEAVHRVTPEVEQLAGIRDVAGNIVANRSDAARPGTAARADGTTSAFVPIKLQAR